MYCVLGVVGFVACLCFAPVPHPNKELSDRKSKRSKVLSTLLFIFFTLLGIAFRKTYETIGASIFYTLLTVLLLMFIKSKERRKKNGTD